MSESHQPFTRSSIAVERQKGRRTMISNYGQQRIVPSLRQFTKKTAWGFISGIVLVGIFVSASVHAAVFTVNSPSDAVDASPGNGICETAPGNRVCTLRAAIEETNALPGHDDIILPANTYILALLAELIIAGDLTITGAGATTTIIDGNKSAGRNGGVLKVRFAASIANISGVTIRNGQRGGSEAGGGIKNEGTVTLTNSTVRGNNAFYGGGISNGLNPGPSATLTLINSTVSGNNAGVGGGISNELSSPLTLTNSTVSGNSAAGDGGGIDNHYGTLTLTNSTLSGNSAGGAGGGIFTAGSVNLFSSTITNNQAGDGDPFSGGGFFLAMPLAYTFTFQNSIIAGNFPTDCYFGGSTIVSNGNNLLGTLLYCRVLGIAPMTGDAQLGPLQDNGGPTQTHALLAGSPAIDAGNPNGCVDSTGAPLQTDQRGLPRAFDANGGGSAVCDIGAFELNGHNAVPAISISDVTVTEGNSGTVNITFQATLSAPSSQPVTATFATGNGTATGGTDYVTTSGTVTFNPGETSKTITVLVNGDTTVEANETFVVNLTSASNAMIADGQGVGTIINDDTAPIVKVGLSNISTRSRVLTGDNIMIGGFIIDGLTPLRVFIRSRGPSMGGAPFFVRGTLANPLLRLYLGQTVIAQNDNWQDSPNCSQFFCEGPAQMTTTGLDPCQPNPTQSGPPANCNLESAILVTLPPGGYTAMISGADGGTGVALVEVFEAEDSFESELSNISTRSFVQTGDDMMIGGMIIEGSAQAKVLIRARGPSMAGAPFFVPGTLANPFLELHAGPIIPFAQNNDWQEAPSCNGFVCGGAAEIIATGLDPCQPNPGQSTSPPGCAQESAILITLPAGAYTAIVRGADGGIGVGLVEVFEVK